MYKQYWIQIRRLKQRLNEVEAELTRLKQWQEQHAQRDDVSSFEYDRYVTIRAYRPGGDGK